MMKSVSLVISLYNSQQTCIELISRLRGVITCQPNYTFEFVFVDDASEEFDLSPFKQLIEEGYAVKVIRHKQNKGQIVTILTGLYYSSGDFVIIMSSDLQDPPELIKEMLICSEKSQSEVVACVRKHRKDSFNRKVGAFFWYKIITLFINPKYPKKGGDYVLLNRRIVDLLLQNTSTVRFLQHEIIQTTQNIVYIEYIREANRKRKTEWKFKKIIQLISDVLFLQINSLKLNLLMNVLLIALFMLVFFLTNNLYVLLLALLVIIISNTLFFLQVCRFRKRMKIQFEPENISEMLLK